MQTVNPKKCNTILDFIDHSSQAAQINNNNIKIVLFNILRYKFIARINTNKIKLAYLIFYGKSLLH